MQALSIKSKTTCRPHADGGDQRGVSNKDEYSGRLRVWEYDGSNGTAIDFVLYRKTDGKVLPSVSGMLRSNSRYE
jgi:hypothetical protein